MGIETDITSRFLAAVLLDSDVLADQRHRLILGAILSLLDAGESVDVLKVADHLATHGLLDAAGGRPFLLETVNTWS